MPKRSRILLIAMSAAFGLCILGLIGGMFYDLTAVSLHPRSLETVLGNCIPYY